ncbi:TetR/AcrR family transcriptional regulator [Streptomyces lincolnensis]|uniref:TetR/AcrR family transcriptional regulator n=1 Tax=Streptomyces lincolnensis TaxID=1915 RepID=UPI001E40DC9E|nr:TetR/AcrR family transcriptional regulator [Streptomyces lincolnensis]MCD7437280.1 TetR/AcrR family transcriptional regulator [Streptomyces lincolnensis]
MPSSTLEGTRMVKQERARRTREKVLDAAAEEFAVQGYSRATLNAVAARTGMTKGALYGHFASKRLLAGALLSQSHEAWEEMLLARDTPGVTARTALESLVLDLAHRLKADIRLRAALRLATDCPSLSRAVPDVFEDVRRNLVDLIRRAQREGSMPPRPPELVAQLLLAAMHGALHVSFGPAGCGRSATWDAVWRLLLDALSGDAGEPSGGREAEGGVHAG